MTLHYVLTPEQAQSLADPRGTGGRVVAAATGPLLTVLIRDHFAGLDADTDGHIDSDGTMWVGGADYPTVKVLTASGEVFDADSDGRTPLVITDPTIADEDDREVDGGMIDPSEDAGEWERIADRALIGWGWRRVGPWDIDTTRPQIVSCPVISA